MLPPEINILIMIVYDKEERWGRAFGHGPIRWELVSPDKTLGPPPPTPGDLKHTVNLQNISQCFTGLSRKAPDLLCTSFRHPYDSLN